MKKWLINLAKFIFASLPFVIVFVASLKYPIDRDLGWHLKYGEYFFTHNKLLGDNIFSTEMPAYKYINSAWGTDILTYLVFHNLGFIGISLLGALVITLTFYFFSKAASLSLYQQSILFPLILYMEQPVIGYSFRGQLVSLLGLGILYYILSRFEQKGNKIILLVIPLFLIWVNMHGQFLLGLGLFTLWMIFYLVRLYFLRAKKKTFLHAKSKLLFLTFIGTLIATILNPYGLKIHQEVFKHFENPLLLTIEEWSPPRWHSLIWQNLIVWTILICVTLVFLLFRKKILPNIFYIASTTILLLLSFNIRRYIWPMFFVSIPIVSQFIKKFEPSNKRIAIAISFAILIASYIYFSFIVFPKESLLSMGWNKYCYYVRCSPQSADYLQRQNFKGKLFSEYGWGGWLIWNYPSLKPSIDGRMAFWQDESGYNAFAKYYILENNLSDINNSKYDIVYIPPTKPIFNRMLQLAKEKKWKLVYQDGFAFIFVRI